MTVVAVIAGTALRRLYRDRIALFFTVALPLLIIFFVGLSVGGGGGDRDLPVGLVVTGDGVQANGGEAARLVAALRAENRLAWRDYPGEEELRAAVRRGDVLAGVLVGAEGAALRVRFVPDPGGTRAGPVRAIVSRVVEARNAVLMPVRFARARTGVSEARAEAIVAAAPAPVVVTRHEVVAAAGGLDGFDYTAAANLILFVFITSLATAAGLIATRQLGVLDRMRAAPVSEGQIVLGQATSRFAIALTQAAIVLVGATVLFRVRWGDPVATGAVIVLFCLVSAGAGLLVATTFSREQQASSLGPPVGIALGMLGGTMWPLEVVPPPMRVVGHLTPHAWAMDALVAVGGGAGLTDIGRELAVLALFAVVLLGVGVRRLGRERLG